MKLAALTQRTHNKAFCSTDFNIPDPLELSGPPSRLSKVLWNRCWRPPSWVKLRDLDTSKYKECSGGAIGRLNCNLQIRNPINIQAAVHNSSFEPRLHRTSACGMPHGSYMLAYECRYDVVIFGSVRDVRKSLLV